MKSIRIPLFTTALVLTSASAHADDMRPGFELGARVGYGVPIGKLVDKANADISDGVSGKIPFILDVGYRVTPALYIGAFGQYAIGIAGDELKDSCDDGVDCAIRVTRIGLNLHYHFTTTGTTFPWIGAGFGYETLSIRASKDDNEEEIGYQGFEYVNLQGGVDFLASPGLRVGPFAQFSLGEYSEAYQKTTANDRNREVSVDLDDDQKTPHLWLSLGVRGAYTF